MSNSVKCTLSKKFTNIVKQNTVFLFCEVIVAIINNKINKKPGKKRVKFKCVRDSNSNYNKF